MRTVCRRECIDVIVIDTSALVAMLRSEPEAAAFVRAITVQDSRLISAVSVLEASMVLAAHDGSRETWLELDALIKRFAFEVRPHDAALTDLAREAFLRFGKGRHPAKLNFGDCASYALAKSEGSPLLFKGQDFSKTDIVAAV